MRRTRALALGWVIVCLALPPGALAITTTGGTDLSSDSGPPVVTDPANDKGKCSQAAPGPVIALPNATGTFNACSSSTVSATDIGTTATGTGVIPISGADGLNSWVSHASGDAAGSGNATYLPKWTATATGTGTTSTLGNSVISDDGTNAVIGATTALPAMARLDLRGALDNTHQETLLSLGKRSDADRAWKVIAGKFTDSVWGDYSLRFNAPTFSSYVSDFVIGLGVGGRLRIGSGTALVESSISGFTDRFAVLNNGNVCVGSLDCATPFAVNSSKTFTVDASGNINVNAAGAAYARIGKYFSLNSYASGGPAGGMGSNIYYDGANWKHLNTGPGLLLWGGANGEFSIYTVPSGTGGNNISALNARLSVYPSGGMSLGPTYSDPGAGNLYVSGNLSGGNITSTPGASKIPVSLVSGYLDDGWIAPHTLYGTNGIGFVSTVTVTATDSLTQSGTATATASKTATSSALQTASTTLTATSSVTATGTFAATGTYTASGTVTQSMSATVTVTGTVTMSVTDTYMATATATGTQTASGSATATVTSSMTQTYSSTFTRTATGTGTRTFTQNGVQNLSVTQTVTITGTATVSATGTLTGTRTATDTTTATSATVFSNPTISVVEGYAMVPGGDRFIAQDTECSGYLGYAPTCDCAAGTPVNVVQGSPWTLYFGGSGTGFPTWMPPGKIRIWQWMAAPLGGNPSLFIDVGICDSATYTMSTVLGTVGWTFTSSVFAQRYAEIELTTGTTFPVSSGLCFKYYNTVVGAPAAVTGSGHITRIYAPYLPATQRGQ